MVLLLDNNALKTAIFQLASVAALVVKFYGHQSPCFIHVIKPTYPYFEHTKDEPDISKDAQGKGHIPVTAVLRTPCTSIF